VSPLIIALGRDRSLNYALCELLKTRDIHCEPYEASSITHEELVKLGPNLVLLDLNHPKDPSLKILTAIRHDQRLQQTKVMILTTESCSKLPNLHLADAVLIVPCQIDVLETEIHYMLADLDRQNE
jgi:DNA-binding response OmpR family regulator